MSILGTLVGPVTGLLDKFIEDKDQKAKLAHELATMADRHAQEALLAQLAINKEEAKGNWFQSSWRPLIGWICGLSLAINYMISPICAGFGITIPQADMTVMMPLLLGMLGIGGLRSFDKYFQRSMSASSMVWGRVAELRAIGTNTNADGSLLQYGDLSTIAKTFITYPAEVLVPQGRFSNTQKKFSSGTATFDSTV